MYKNIFSLWKCFITQKCHNILARNIVFQWQIYYVREVIKMIFVNCKAFLLVCTDFLVAVAAAEISFACFCNDNKIKFEILRNDFNLFRVSKYFTSIAFRVQLINHKLSRKLRKVSCFLGVKEISNCVSSNDWSRNGAFKTISTEKFCSVMFRIIEN